MWANILLGQWAKTVFESPVTTGEASGEEKEGGKGSTDMEPNPVAEARGLPAIFVCCSNILAHIHKAIDERCVSHDAQKGVCTQEW